LELTVAVVISGEGFEPEEILEHPDVDCWPERDWDCCEIDSEQEELEGS
jgi:hypothetical protein